MKEEWKPYLLQVQTKYPDLPLAEQIYMAKNMDLDKGLQSILDVYDYQGKLDNLVIAIYGDHHPKGAFLEGSDFDKVCTQKGLDVTSCLETPFIIWNNDAFVGENAMVSSPIDISPTLYDLFGISYDPQKVLGHSVFDPDYRGFYFDANGTIATNDFTYNLISDEVVTTGSLSEEGAKAQAQDLGRQLELGHKIIENNYFETAD